MKTLSLVVVALVATAGIAMAGLGPNPANQKKLIAKPLEDFRYDHAHKCRDKLDPGVRKMLDWLARHTDGASWSVYRCEKLSPDNYSLHAESRAID